MQMRRLFQIAYHLLDKGQATAPELAEKFEVSVRTIYRDLDALSLAGIPVYAEAGRNGGIRLMNGFVLDRAALSDEEKQEILTAMQSMRAARSRDGDGTLQKLSALFRLEAKDWIEVDFSGWGKSDFENEKFELLKAAVIRRKCVRILYAGSCGDVSDRIVQPCRLSYKARAWYVKAFCTKRQAWRMFKLSRILDLEERDESFLPRSVPEEAGGPQEEYGRITLRFAKEAACRVYDEFDAAQVRRQENGDLVVSARMPEDAWLTGFLLSFGTQAEVLSPASLKESLAMQAKLIYEKNKS